MSRPLQAEFPGALYHVTSRGDRREAIYLDDADCQHWLALFGQVCRRFNWICHAYCLMDNHFHIVVEPVEGNLSAGMRQLKGRLRITARMAASGMCFRGALKPSSRSASLTCSNWRAMSSSTRCALVCAPCPSCGPEAATAPRWAARRHPNGCRLRGCFHYFGGQPETASDAYIAHVRAGIGLPSVWEHLKSQLCLGDDDFAKALQQHTQGQAGQTEIPKAQRRATAPPLAHFATLPERDSAMAQAYATGS